jgi:hypothetical protein
MKNTNGSDDWRVLCELASKEKDPETLIDLVVRLNQALEECTQKPRYQKTEKIEAVLLPGESAPVDANAYSHSVAPQFSSPPELRLLVFQ